MNNEEMTAEDLKNLKHNALGVLSQIRQQMVMLYPFIGNVLMKLNIVPIRDVRCRTASTDGTNIYFDIAFLAELTEQERFFVLAHEVWHNVMLHFGRRQGRDINIFNIATDLEVNQILLKEKLRGPSNICWPNMYNVPANLSAEEYYELLIKQQNNIKNKTNKSKLAGQFDKHQFEDTEPNDSSFEGDTYDKYGKVGFDDDYNPSVSKDAVEKMREKVISAAQQYEKCKGKLPGHIETIVNKLKEPEIRWQEVLAQFVTKCFGEKRMWSPPNRRHIWHDTYLQSRRGEIVKIAVGIDTSGSTVNDISKFLGELNGLMNTFGRYEIHLIECDTEVTNYKLYTDGEQLQFNGKDGFSVHGGGGTTLHPIFDYIKDNNFDVDSICIFTDGWIEEFPIEDDPKIPTLWLISKDGQTDQIKFGEIVKFKDSSDI